MNVLCGVVKIQLVLWRNLPCDSARKILILNVFDRRPAQIWRIKRCALRRVPIVASHELVYAPVSSCAKEPHFVHHDRSAESPVEVPNVIHGVDTSQTARAQGIIQVVALEPVSGAVREEESRKALAALFGNQVNDNSGNVGFSGRAAFRDIRLGRHLTVEHDAA